MVMPPRSFFYHMFGFFGILISAYYSVLYLYAVVGDLYYFGIDVFIPRVPDMAVSHSTESLIYGIILLALSLSIMYALRRRGIAWYRL